MLAILMSVALQAATPAAASAPSTIPAANWKRAPIAGEVASAFPDHAAARGVSGEATLKCRINDLGMPFDCSIYSETPKGEGFGKALMNLRSKILLHPLQAGEGPRVLLTQRFEATPDMMRLAAPPKYRVSPY